jgi:hypothetical protein
MDEKKTIALDSREAVLLHIAIRYLGGSYVKWKRKRGVTAEHKAKCDAYVDECRAIADKLKAAFGFTEGKTLNDDGTEFVPKSKQNAKKKED